MGGASSVFLTPELCQKLTEKSIIEFHQFETDCISRNLSADEIHDSLSSKYEALLLRDHDFSSYPKYVKPSSPVGKKPYNRNNKWSKQQGKGMNNSVSLKSLPSEAKGSSSRRLHSSTASSRQRVTNNSTKSNKWETTVDNATKAKQRAELRSKIYQQYSSLPPPKANPSASNKGNGSVKLDENRAFGGSSTSVLRRIPQRGQKTAVRTGSLETMPTLDNNDCNSDDKGMLLASSMSCDDLSTLGGIPFLDGGESCVSFDLQDDDIQAAYSPNPYFQFKSMDENDNLDDDDNDQVVVGFHDNDIDDAQSTALPIPAMMMLKEQASLTDCNSSAISNSHHECRLCRRKFNSSLLLETHIAFSQVHRQALSELRERYSKGHEEADRLGKLLKTTVERFQRSLMARKAHLEGRISIAKLRWRQAIGRVIASFVTSKYNSLLSTLNRPLAAATAANSKAVSVSGSKAKGGVPLLVLQQSRFFWRTNGRFVFNIYLHSLSDPMNSDDYDHEEEEDDGMIIRRVLEIVPQLLPSDPTRPSTALNRHNPGSHNKSQHNMSMHKISLKETAVMPTVSAKAVAEEGNRFYLDLDQLRLLIKRQNQRHDQLQHHLSFADLLHEDEAGCHHKYRLSEISSLARAAISSEFLSIDYQKVIANPSTQAKALCISFPPSSHAVLLSHRPAWISQPAIISPLRLYHGSEVASKLEEVRQGQMSLRHAVRKADELATAAHAALSGGNHNGNGKTSNSKNSSFHGKSGLLRLSPRMLVVSPKGSNSNGGGLDSKGKGKSFRFSSSAVLDSASNSNGGDLSALIDASMTQSFAHGGSSNHHSKAKPAMLS